MKAFITTSFIAAALLGSALAFAQPQGGPWGHHMGGFGGHGHFQDALNLTDDQKASAKTLHEELMAKAKPLHTQARQQMKEIGALLDAAKPDAAVLGQKMIAAHATRMQMKALHDEFETKFSALLDADQLAKFQKMQAMRREFRDGMPGDGPPPGDQE